jgi:hypothetical protein
MTKITLSVLFIIEIVIFMSCILLLAAFLTYPLINKFAPDVEIWQVLGFWLGFAFFIGFGVNLSNVVKERGNK